MRPNCNRPLAPAALADYWFDEALPSEQEEVEEHLMECGECSGRLRSFVLLGEAVRRAARDGAVQVVVTPSFLEEATRNGLRMREYRAAPGASVACTVTAEDDLVVSRLQADFRGVTRLDLVSSWEGHPERRIDDLPVAPAAGEVIVAQVMPALRALGPSVIRMRLLAHDTAGERLLGEYTFAHSPGG